MRIILSTAAAENKMLHCGKRRIGDLEGGTGGRRA
jgi:hypothetical protein